MVGHSCPKHVVIEKKVQANLITNLLHARNNSAAGKNRQNFFEYVNKQFKTIRH